MTLVLVSESEALFKTRSRMTTATTFSRRNDAASRASTTYYSENVLLVVVLVLRNLNLSNYSTFYKVQQRLTQWVPVTKNLTILLC